MACAWSFLADSNNQLTLADALTEAANNFDSKKGEMFGKIDNMGNHWKGEDYDLFNTSAHNYDPALQDFSDSIRMYASQFEKISGATEQLATELISIIMNMTGSGTASGSGTGPGGSGPVPDGTGTTPGGTGANGIGDPAQTGTEDESQTWYQKIGNRYADDWNDYTGDVSRAWANADGLFSGAHALGVTVAETGLMVSDMVIDTAQAAVSTVQAGANWLFDAGDTRAVNGSYWDTIGQDYAENWDFSSVDNFGEGVGVALTGTVRTVVDVGQTAVNAVCDVGNAIGDGISWVGDKITDGLSWLGGKIFG